MTAEATDPRSLPKEGALAEWALPTLLVRLARQRFEGRLILTQGRQEKTFTFERGAPVLAESNLASEALGAQLVDQGVLDRTDYERVCEQVEQRGCREGVALLALELLKPKELFHALKDQVRRRMVDCFGWPEGCFRVEAAETRSEDASAFRCDPLALAQEGLETHWSIERMLTDLTPHLESFPKPRKEFGKWVRRLQTEPDHASLLAGLDGTRMLGQTLGPAFGSPRTLAAVWLIDALGIVDYLAQPATDGEGPGFDSEIEISVGDAPAEEKRAGRTARKKAAAQGNGDEAASLRAEIEKRKHEGDELDHYQLLGVAPDAKAGAIKKAYFKAAKQYHPDTLARLGLEDVREDASAVFARIAEAFEVLSDAQRRKDYDAELRGELTEADAVRLAQAETSYRKGEILLRMGDFQGALEYLAPAVEIWPDESAYQSALGWALFKQQRPDPAAARAHLTQAVRLGPEDATAHIRLSMVLRELGEREAAEKLIARARTLDPEVG